MMKLLIEQKRTNTLIKSLLVFGLAVGAGVVLMHWWIMAHG